MSAPEGSRPPGRTPLPRFRPDKWNNWPLKRLQGKEESSSDEESEIEIEPSTDEELSDSSSSGDDDDDDNPDDDGNAIAANNNMASNANPPALHPPAPPVQGNPPIPFAPAPNNPGNVLCPLCAPPLKNDFKRSSMETHFLRKHSAQEFVHWFGVQPPPVHPCPLPQCGNGPFIKQSDLNDHMSERHNQPLPAWRTKFNKQKRRPLVDLITDYVNEAASLNSLIQRIRVAEANKLGHYVSRHGLPLGRFFQTNPALVPTNPADLVRNKTLDVATQLVAMRNTADLMGPLLGGGVGTWNQVANELEQWAGTYQAIDPSLASAWGDDGGMGGG